ncbi:MAG: site-specific integrase [Candidatus Izemoplasmatales bacterium]|nr:site-specific integrase [Candidatus Izemoplasmatales bacterium]
MYLEHSKKYNSHGTYLYYKKNFKSLLLAFNKINVAYVEDVDDQIFEKLTDYYLNLGKNKNSKINDIISSSITVFRFYSVPIPKRYKLRDDTTGFKALNQTEYSEVKKYVNSLDINNPNNISWGLSILLLLDTGVRLSELFDIKFKNVDLTTESIYLEHTKNGKKRYVLFGKLSRKFLVAASKQKKEYVIWNYNKNARMNKYSLYHFLDKMNVSLEFKHNIHPHRLRKTFATRLLIAGCPLTTISKLLGHSDIKQTMIYLEIDYSMLKLDYDNYYPYDDN